MFQAKVVEKIKRHLMFNNFFFENRYVYEAMWRSADGTSEKLRGYEQH